MQQCVSEKCILLLIGRYVTSSIAFHFLQVHDHSRHIISNWISLSGLC